MTVQDKARGSLFGGAVGDALGYAVEFSSLNAILSKYGESGIVDYALDARGVARFSDDTQMTLFTAEGLLSAYQDNADPSSEDITRHITVAYLAWYATQTEFQLPIRNSWLTYVRDLWARRAPGNTCLSALRDIKEGHPVENTSKGCGGVMRVAPIGIFYAAHPQLTSHNIEFISKTAADVAAITHHHAMSDYSSSLLALIIFHCIREEQPMTRSRLREITEQSLQVAIDSSIATQRNKHTHHETSFKTLMRLAMELAEGDLSDFEAIRRLGEGWVAEETLAIALFSALRYVDDFSRCLVCAVNHDGDSDSTGAVAGNIIGAILGFDAIPVRYKLNLEISDVILSVTDDLSGASNAEQLKERYAYHHPYALSSDLNFINTMKFTPEKITELGPDEVFVFGSNLAGHHAGGAARTARKCFGAIEGQGVGMQGQSYAIPTMQGGVETIKPYVDEFIEVARECDQNTFYVTRIGCGIAGFADEEIAPLFREALTLYNVRLPESFVRILMGLQK